MASFNNYRHFSYVSTLKNASQVTLLSKIYNRDTRKDNLSLVYATADKQVFAYGSNDSGCLGLATLRLHFKVPTPIKELCGKTLAKISSGNRFVIVLTQAGHCYSWGDNKFGQLGLGKSVASVNKPVLIDSLKGEHIVDVSCGQFHVLLLTADYRLYAFGSNVSGAIGNGTTFHQSKPVYLTNIAEANCTLVADIVTIAAGGWHSAALNLKGELFVWGWGEHGQCGQESKSNQVLPSRVLLPSLPGTSFPCQNAVVKSVQCGLHHTLALTSEALVFAFGSNEFGECAQDMKIKLCFKPVTVALEEPILEICALSKSRLSMARSQLHFYVWGQSSQTSSNNQSPNVPRKFTISQQVQSSLSFNMMLAKNEVNEFNVDGNTNKLPFSSSAIVIADRSVRPSNGKLNHTFNNPAESDTVFVFPQPSSSVSSSSSSQPNTKTIFVQKAIIEGYSNFLTEFSSKFCTNKVDKSPQEGEETKLEQVTMTVGRNKMKFYQLIIERFSYETLYVYLFFIYSNYIFISPDQLVKIMQLCQTMNNEALLKLCLQYIQEDFSLLQLCSLYKLALQEKLSKVCNFCTNQARQILEDSEIGSQLYNSRDSGDLVLTCTDANGKVHNILAHRLVLKVQSKLYLAIVDPLIQQSNSSQLAQLNKAASEEDLLLSDTLNFGTFFTVPSLELFIRLIYSRKVPSQVKLTVPVLIDLAKASKLFGEHQLEEFCIEQLKDSITVNNVCHLYVTYSQQPENFFLVEMFIKVISENLNAFLISADFRSLLNSQSHIVFEIFLNLSNYALTLNSTY